MFRTIFIAVFIALVPFASQATAAPALPSHPDGGGEQAPMIRGIPQAPTGATDILNVDTGLFYPTIAAALAHAPTLDGHTLEVQVANHSEGTVAVNKEITLRGLTGTETVFADANTVDDGGDGRAWFLVTAPNFTVENLTFDGTGFSIFQAFRITTGGDNPSFDNCTIQNIGFSIYAGNAIVQFNGDGLSVTNCTFSNIQRHGIFFFGSAMTSGVASGNTYTGKGAGDFLDYGIEVGGGAVATLTNNTITDCIGVASSDGSTSAGILITTYFGAGTAADLTGNFLNANDTGCFVGFDATDVAVVTAFDNDLSGNTFGMVGTSTTVTTDASGNWWGSNDGPTLTGYISGDIDYTPWLDVGTDTGGAGFEGDFSTLNVDDDSPQIGPIGRVQEGVNLVTASTVWVWPGTYVEQVDIDKDLLLIGFGPTSIIEAPASMPLFFTSSADNYPILYIHDTDNVTVQDLTVDGAGKGNTNVRFVGVGYSNAGGSLIDCDVIDVRDTPFSGAQHGVGIISWNDDTVSRNITVSGCTFTGFQKNAMALAADAATPLVVDVSGNTIVGAGATTVTAQNGVQVYGDLITGLIFNNNIDGIAYDNTASTIKWVATSILNFFAEVDIDQNTVTGGHVPIYNIDGSGTISNNDLTVVKVGVSAFGIVASDPPQAVPHPFDQPSGGSSSSKMGPAFGQALITVDVTGNTVAFSGIDNTDTFGIEADGGFGPDDLAITITDNTVTGFEIGIELYQCPSSCPGTGVITSASANYNDIVGNTGFGLRSNLGFTVDATCNWWGDIGGPDDPPGNPNPAGDAISGSMVYGPWLDGSIAGTPNCDQFGPNNVAPDGDDLCLSTSNTCVTVPVIFHRLDTSSARSISVTFQLSPELQLCSTPVLSILQGPWLGAFPSGYVVVDNGGGSYTVDQAILGSPCGVTTGGMLFTIDVTNTVPDGVGTITVTDVDVRDCGNPFSLLPGIPGPLASLLIDTTLPAAMADLAAAQVKTGNDGDGTTGITLTWGAVETGATVEVYRKGFGFYPEYDDLGGAVPATPATPAAALGASWVLSSVFSSPGVDETSTERDFMYFVAFVTDSCGNVSAVSNQTGGTLNYHLGDFVPLLGGPLPLGDNLVDALDISKLGAHYGTQDGDALYLDTLDVGPTGDHSPDDLPDTDNRIQFEDLIITAINFGQVSKPGAPPAAQNALAVAVAEIPGVGGTFEVALDLSSDGSIKGVSIPLRYNASVVEPVGHGPGELLDRQAGQAVFLSPELGTVDAAVFGSSFTGEGRLGTVRFQVIAAGAPNIGLGEVIARDKDNQPVALDGSIRTLGQDPTLPAFTGLIGAAPNPFAAGTVVRFSMAEEGPAQVRIFAVDGRLVKTLLDGFQAAGEQAVSWDGRDDSGRSTAAGTYLIQFRSRSTQQAERIVRLR